MEAQYLNRNPITESPKHVQPVPFSQMEAVLAKELASNRIMEERVQREKDRLYSNSDQIKEL